MKQIQFDKKQSFDLFQIDENKLAIILQEASGKGADFSDIYFEHSYYTVLVLQDGKVSQVQSSIDFGAGVRAVKNVHTGYAYSETCQMEDLLRAAKIASNISNSNKDISPIFVEKIKKHNRYPIFENEIASPNTLKKTFLETLNSKIFSLDKRVIKVSLSISESTKKILYANILGEIVTDIRPMISISANCTMEEGSQVENNYTSISYRKDITFITNEIIDEIANKLVKQTSELFEAKRPKGGEMPVVLGAGDSGILLHEAIGHAFEADFTRKGESIFGDKLGKTICNENITIVDDGTIEGERGSVNYDDEGIEGQKTVIVNKGKLESFLHDRISAKYYGVSPTGNGRRESFRNIPLPRMRITCMENGEHNIKDLISSVKYGIYAVNYSNGQVQIGEGDFTFFVKFGFIIENGRLTQPIKNVNIIGNGPQALKNISMISNDFKLNNDAGVCGKDGQSVAVGYGIPSVLVDKLTVGGY